eukprot:SAG11_NODE_8574_length_999_cov_1.491111_2_plen_123_part_00
MAHGTAHAYEQHRERQRPVEIPKNALNEAQNRKGARRAVSSRSHAERPQLELFLQVGGIELRQRCAVDTMARELPRILRELPAVDPAATPRCNERKAPAYAKRLCNMPVQDARSAKRFLSRT